jgi:hypothetical protein
MKLVENNLKSLTRMGKKKDWEPVGMNPVKRNMKSIGRMG